MKIYTDGSCFPNPDGCGGWAFVAVQDNNVVYTKSGSEPHATNNTMEFRAIIEAMKWADGKVTIYSDSQYCVNAINIWYHKWVVKRKLNKMKNVPLIEEAVRIKKEKGIWLSWIRGHAENEFNEIADELCKEEMLQLHKEFYGVDISISDLSEYKMY